MSARNVSEDMKERLGRGGDCDLALEAILAK